MYVHRKYGRLGQFEPEAAKETSPLRGSPGSVGTLCGADAFMGVSENGELGQR
jgi:hypothetical protein